MYVLRPHAAIIDLRANSLLLVVSNCDVLVEPRLVETSHYSPPPPVGCVASTTMAEPGTEPLVPLGLLPFVLNAAMFAVV